MSNEILELKAALYDKQQEIQNLTQTISNFNKFALDVSSLLELHVDEALTLDCIHEAVKDMVESKSCSLDFNDEASGD